MTLVLHGYYRSSAAFRVRIALNLKGVAARAVFHHLRKGEQRAPDFLALNPQGLVPALETAEGVITQSLAIIEYLDETIAGTPLLPKDAFGRARVRSLAQAVACDIHPIDNLRVLNYLRNELGQDEAAVQRWFNHWIAAGFDAIEIRLGEPQTGMFMHGDVPTLADICLIPQVTNARNFNLDLSPYPRIQRIYDAAMALAAFVDAAPSQQPDAE
jgi:maleylacetoacetate isomerase